MKRPNWKCGYLLIVAAVTAAQGATLFVDAGAGDDANSGTAAAKPFLTIQKAVNEAAARPGPDVIQIAPGRYLENVVIEDLDSVTLSGKPGVEIADPSSPDKKKEVIYVKRGDVKISDVKVTEGKYGIRGKGSTDAPIYLTLTRVEAVDNPGRGLRADNVRDVSISDCQFLRNNNDGIKVGTDADLDRTNANFSIKNTLISGSADDGIDLEKLGDIRIVNVTVQDPQGKNADDGLSIDDSVSVFIVNCAFLNSAADGIDIDDTEAITIVSTLSAQSGGSGMQIKAEEHFNTQSIRVVDSAFLDNGADGIWISEEDAVVESVMLHKITATGNGGSGLDILVSGPVKFSAITSENNTEPDVL